VLDQDHIHSARTRAQRPPRPLRGDRHLLPLGRRLTVASREDAEIAAALLADVRTVHGAPGSVHDDLGTSMTSKPVAELLVDLGVTGSPP
jgi:hypothetical protein